MKEGRQHSENSDDDDEDWQWEYNEEIFASFQENMALIAGNSFEILKLYEMIRSDYAKVTERVEKSQEHAESIHLRS